MPTDPNITAEILSAYRRLGSIRAVSKDTGIPTPRVRRILIDAGELVGEKAETIRKLYESGLTREEIAARLGVKPVTVDAHSPYRKGTYTGASATTAWRRTKDEASEQERNMP